MSKAFVTLALLCSTAALAQIEELENPGSVAAVQSRPYRMKHELSLTLGALPLDAFYKGFQAQVGYTFHFNDLFAWQVGRGAYVYRVQTDLRNELERKFAVLPTASEQIEYFVGSDLLFTPLYGKLAVGNRSVIHGQVFLLGGFTMFKFTNAFRPAVNLGGGARLFVSQNVSFRIQLDNHLVIPTGAATSSVQHVMSVNASLAINFGGGDR